MVTIQNYGAFLTAIIVFQIIPGAGTVVILSTTARKGLGAGMMSVLGTLSGDFICMSAAVLGLAAILNAYPRILAGAQWIGVLYLCRMGWRLLRSATADQSPRLPPSQGRWDDYRQALAVSLTNPKVIMFFMAFFPLFLTETSGPPTLFVLMLHVSLISLIYQTALVFIGNKTARHLAKRPGIRNLATRSAGALLIGFGIRLACNNR